MSTTTYSTGTVSVGAGSTAVTGVGTAWLTGGIRAGDRLVLAGLTARIASVNSNTSITLARGWPGSAQSGADYDIWLEDDGVRSLVAANALLQALGAGTLTSLGALEGAANLMPYWTGAGVMAATPVTAAGRALLDDADAAAMRATLDLVKTANASDTTAGRVLQTVAGPAQAFRRGNILGVVSQTGGVPNGALIESGSNANGKYTRWANGWQECIHDLAMGSVVTSGAGTRNDPYRTGAVTWTYPAAFFEAPSVHGMAFNQNSTFGPRCANSLHSFGTGLSTTTIGLVVVRNTDRTDADTITARVTAVGRWF